MLSHKNMSKTVVIIDGVRTPYVKSGADFNDVSVVDLGVAVAKETLARTNLNPSLLDEVIFGNIGQPADAANVTRVVALRAGIPQKVPAYTVQRNCASGMQSIANAYDRIQAGQGELFLCGGIESMSNIPLLFPKTFSNFLAKLSRAKNPIQKIGVFTQFRLNFLKPIIAILQGLMDPVCGLNMGQTAEVLAREFKITREAQDQFALLSHEKTIKAQEKGFFKDEIVPLFLKNKAVAQDVGPRKNQNLEALAKLKPFFDRKHGTVTAGNSCPITDGGAALLVTTEEKAQELGLKPKVRIINYAFAGLDPARMGLGPSYATSSLLKKTNTKMEDIDLVEMNEAFAAQVLANLKTEPFLKMNPDILNVNGGAIALGHPVGSSGTRIVLTLMNEMKRRNAKRGVATICIGGGQGGAMLLENV